MAFIAASFLQAFCAALPLRPVPTTAANSAIRCRCGIAFCLAPCHRLSHHTPYLSSTFRRCAVFPRFRLTFRRCVESPHLRERSVSVFLLPPWHSHLPKVRRFPVFSSHLPKVCGVATSSRALCVSVSPATVAFPPSKGAQISRVFVSPSEGARSRHCFESALCPCFSCGRAFPTFRRCAVFPHFRLTFRRCVDSSQLRERPVSVFLQPPCVSHLPKVCSIPAFSSHLPKVRSFRCSRCNHFEKAGCALS